MKLALTLFALAAIPPANGNQQRPPALRLREGGDDESHPTFDPRWPPHEPRWIELREFYSFLPFV